jgi:hypothetical protein
LTLEKAMKLLAKIAYGGLCAALAGASATALYADPAGGWLSPSGVSGTTSAKTDPVSGEAVIPENLSAPEVQARVKTLHDQMRSHARHIQYLQQIARKEKDVIKLNCVNDKLVQVKPQINIADLSEAKLEGAGDGDRMSNFVIIVQSAENVRQLREEADQCIGEPIQISGDSSNSFTGPEVPDDPNNGLAGNEIEPPGYASPFN